MKSRVDSVRIIILTSLLVLFPSQVKAADLIAWFLRQINPGEYAAIVQTNSTGGGRVYTEGSQDSSTSGSEESIGIKSTTTSGGNLTFQLKAFPSNGYSFAGWDDVNPSDGVYESTDLTYNLIVSASTTASTSDETYAAEYHKYAFFTPIRYTVRFSANGGGGSMSPMDYYTTDKTRLSCSFTAPDGYEFNGWKPESSSGSWRSSTTYQSTSTVEGSYGDVTLVAQWRAIRYTITYNTNGGSMTSGSTSQTYYVTDTFTLRSARKTGSTFYGWKVTSADGNWYLNEGYVGGASLTGKHGYVTLTAQWNPLPCDIVISVTGLAAGESAIFNVSKGGSVIFTVAVSSESPTVTIKSQEVGEYTVTPAGWAYSISPASITETLSYPNTTFSFSSTASNPKKHAEQSNTNWGL